MRIFQRHNIYISKDIKPSLQEDIKMSKDQLINFRYDRAKWHIIKLITSRMMTSTKTGEIVQATGSDIIRELLDEWLSEHSLEWFPRILKDFKIQGIQNRTTELLTKAIKDYAKSAMINKDNADLEKLRQSLHNAGFSETEIYELLEGEKNK